MPQASDELRAQWPGGDAQAEAHLGAKGFTLDKTWQWYLPHRTYEMTDKDRSAIQYMADEWDYGGLAPTQSLAPTEVPYLRPKFTAGEQYAIGLFEEETGEASRLFGKAFRFGLDVPGRLDATGEPDLDYTPRNELPAEVGDVMAAIECLFRYGVVNREACAAFAQKKLLKLQNGHDNMGRRLAPPFPEFIHGPDGTVWEEKKNYAQEQVSVKPDKPNTRWGRFIRWFAPKKNTDTFDF